MPFTVLTDADVREVLDMLTKDDVLDMHKQLADALHSYSTATDEEDSGCCSSNQPMRLSLKLKNGATTLFMPATTDHGLGVKVVTIGEGTQKGLPGLPLRSSTTDSSSFSSSEIPKSPSTPRSGTPRSASPVAVHKRSSSPGGASIATTSSGQRSNITANSSTTALDQPPGVTLPTQPVSHPSSNDTSTSPAGTLTLFSENGSPRAVISANTLTAFRTALASTMLLKKRQHAHTVTVFGAGRQAYWHILLTLLLRGREVHHMNLINRSFERAQKLYVALAQHPSPIVQDLWLTGKLRPSILTPEYGEYTRLLKENVRAADIIYCCTPATTPLFPHGHLTNTEGRRKARYVVAIGSYKPHMQELPVEVLQQAVRGPEQARAHHSHGFHIHHHAASEGGAVVVDSIEGAMRESGEIIKSGIGGQGIVELGELVMLKRSHWAEKAEREERERGRRASEQVEPEEGKKGHGIGHLFSIGHKKEGSVPASPSTPTSPRSKSHDPRESASVSSGSTDRSSRNHKRSKSGSKEVIVDDDGGLHQWLSRGNVIYKSVGIGLMDVVVGMAIVELAEERGIGITFDSL